MAEVGRDLPVSFPAIVLPHGERRHPAVLYCFLFLYLAAAGAGPWSVDAWLAAQRRNRGP
ncbi:MAG: hypothetical protein ACXWLR_08640 [Myxococcales bacterium]